MLKLILKKLRYFELVIYLRNNYTLFAKYYSYLSLLRKENKRPIFVYTMGKVGSTTVTHSLDNQLEEYSVHHLHWLNKRNLNADQKFIATHFRKNKKAGITIDVFPNYLSRGFYFSNKIARSGERTDQYKVITLTRDPVARNISSFFQNLKKWFSYDILLKRQHMNEDLIVDELKTLFVEQYIGGNRINFIDCNPLIWFDQELKTVFDIDVFQSDFPSKKGYHIYEKDNISVLLLRLKNLNNRFEEALKEFFGKEISLKSIKNKGGQKEYSGVYSKFKHTIKIPDWYLDQMYESRYVRHFYTDKEIAAFRRRWD